MIRRIALACTALAALALPARAQLVTFDPTQAFNALQGLMNDSAAAAAQRLAQINNQIAQLVQPPNAADLRRGASARGGGSGGRLLRLGTGIGQRRRPPD